MAHTPDVDASDSESALRSKRLDPQRRDAIHNALLSGLLTNVGAKVSPHEYLGMRGGKFLIFPASSLFGRGPQWLMAAEIVETSRLYARTAAAIRPGMIERLAGHLISRSYSEPHWESDSAHVIAFEKVTLGSLVLSPKRPVHFGPIDPVESRRLFILHALVEGDFKTAAPFYRHNRALIGRIAGMEARLRRRDILADSETRFAFFDSRVPPGIYDGPLFEKWRRGAEQRNRRILYMSELDLLRIQPDQDLGALFPDALNVGPVNAELSYLYDVESPNDGVTATVPLAAVNQLDEVAIDWLIPGWLPAKIEALMRTLPKLARTQFVPIPEFAASAAREMKQDGRSLVIALASYLSNAGQIRIHPRDMNPGELPAYLRLNIRVIDPNGRVVSEGRDIGQIQKHIGLEARRAFADRPDPRFHRDNLRDWDFGDLPAQVEIKTSGVALLGYPALVREKSAVNLRLLDDAAAAKRAHAEGTRQLFAIKAAGELRYLSSRLPHMEELCLNFASVGPCQQLKESISRAMVNEVFRGEPEIRTQAEFARRVEVSWPKLSAASIGIANALWPALKIYAEVAVLLTNKYPLLMQAAIADMQDQLSHLIFGDFVAATPFAWLSHLPRFLQGISLRLKKLMNSGLSRDQAGMTQIAGPWQAYLAAAEVKDELALNRAELETYRWMIEEYRISLFAQELKTSQPISAAKLSAQWERVQRS